jgi:hypothetical protein
MTLQQRTLEIKPITTIQVAEHKNPDLRISKQLNLHQQANFKHLDLYINQNFRSSRLPVLATC